MSAYQNGTVIRATLRSQDLLTAFLVELRSVGGKEPESCKDIPHNELIDNDARIVDDHPWWNSDECQECVSDLMDAINEKAPEGMYFGAHSGDGSDFGYFVRLDWPTDDIDTDALGWTE